MANTTRWIFNKEKFSEDILKNIEKTNLYDWVKGELNNLHNNTLRAYNNKFSFSFKNIEKSDESDEVFINDKNIKYDYFNLTYEKKDIQAEADNDVAETIEIKQTIIIYEKDENVYLIVDKHSGAQAFLRTIFCFDKKEEISQISNLINSDFIVWLIYRVYNEKVTYQINEKTMQINSVIGFKGDIEDNDSTITAKGDKLTNILSTLSFLLETKGLRQVSLRLTYTSNANIELSLTDTNALSIDFSAYKGVYKKEPFKELTDTNKEVLVLLFVYLEILANLKNWYSESKEDKESNESEDNKTDELEEVVMWDSIEHKKFLEMVADDLMKKINEKKIFLTREN